MDTTETIKTLYKKFNDRDINAVLSLVQDDVQWANGWKGGFVSGHEGIRQYWTEQWTEITPFVYPVSVVDNGNRIEVLVHQVVHDKNGKLIVDGHIKHHFLFEAGLIKKFEIENINR
jgi:hypothetical protein